MSTVAVAMSIRNKQKRSAEQQRKLSQLSPSDHAHTPDRQHCDDLDEMIKEVCVFLYISNNISPNNTAASQTTTTIDLIVNTSCHTTAHN
jgi:hypothetical protein